MDNNINRLNYIDIHTHNPGADSEGISVSNLFPEEIVPDVEPFRFYSIGMHPWLLDPSTDIDEQMNQIELKATFPNVIAVGECGFDRMAKTSMEIQGNVFSGHVMIADKVMKPVFIHCVRAFNELIYYKKKLKPQTPWILHGYSGSYDLAMQLYKHGFFFSFGKALLNSRSKAIQSFIRLPEESVFLETDECELMISEIYAHASGLKNCTISEIERQLQANFNKVFLQA